MIRVAVVFYPQFIPISIIFIGTTEYLTVIILSHLTESWHSYGIFFIYVIYVFLQILDRQPTDDTADWYTDLYFKIFGCRIITEKF